MLFRSRQNCQEQKSDGGPEIFLTSSKDEYCPDKVIRSDVNDQNFAVVSCSRKNNEAIAYAFNTKGYLMNDDGKTVESI